MRKTLLAIGLMAVSASSFAADKDEVTSMSNFNYDYAEARIGASPMTFGGGFSKSVHPNAHMVATIDSRFKGDFNLAAGFGFHAPVNNWADLTGEMLFRAVDNDSQDIDTGCKSTLVYASGLVHNLRWAVKWVTYPLSKKMSGQALYTVASIQPNCSQLV